MFFLRQDLLLKSKSSESSAKTTKTAPKQQSNAPGEQRGGKYAARIQVGYEKDGSPKYKYFDSLEERDKYLQSRGKTQVNNKRDLKRKMSREHKDSKYKQNTSQGKVTGGGLFVDKDKKSDDDSDGKDKKDSKSIKKSIPITTPLFVWRIE